MLLFGSELLMILLSVISVVLTVIGICLTVGKKRVVCGKILLSAGVLGIGLMALLVGAFILALSGAKDFYIGMLLVFFLLLYGLFICLLWTRLRRRWLCITLCACLVLCLGATGGYYAYDRYIDSIPTMGENQGLFNRYMPYAPDTEVAELDEESTLKLESDLPEIDGATAFYPIYSAFAKAVYPQEAIAETTIRTDEYPLTCSTTTGAYNKIVAGDTDIIFVLAPSAEQEQYAKDNGVELVYTPIGKEAFVFFVNSKNPLDNITVEEIRSIYSGEITKWSDLGVSGFGDIRAFQRDEGSGSQSALVRLMEGKELMTPPEEDVVFGMGGIISRTADYKNFKNALGYSFRFYATEMVKNNEIKLLSVGGVEPSIENIENGTYPLTSEFYAVTRSDMTENTKRLLEWVTGEQGQKLIELTGYTPIRR